MGVINNEAHITESGIKSCDISYLCVVCSRFRQVPGPAYDTNELCAHSSMYPGMVRMCRNNGISNKFRATHKARG